MNYEKCNLTNLAEGAAPELFDHALEQVLKNIEDVNTDLSKTRKITLEFTLKPSKDRTNIGVSVALKTALAPIKESEVNVQMERDEGKLCVFQKKADDSIPDNVHAGGF